MGSMMAKSCRGHRPLNLEIGFEAGRGSCDVLGRASMSAFYRYSPGHRRQAHRQRVRKESAMTIQHLRVASPPADLQMAIYARVSSDQQAERHTIDSQI